MLKLSLEQSMAALPMAFNKSSTMLHCYESLNFKPFSFQANAQTEQGEELY